VPGKVIGIGAVDAFERQAIQDLATLALRNCLQRCRNRLSVAGCIEFADLPQTDDCDARSAHTVDVGKDGAAPEISGNIAALEVAFDRTLAGGVDIGGTGTQFAAFIDADNDAINGPARGFARGCEIFHRKSCSCWLVCPSGFAKQGLSRAK
jgi:hypothetical protein